MGLAGFSVLVVFRLRVDSSSPRCLGRHDAFSQSHYSCPSSSPSSRSHPFCQSLVAFGDRLLPALPRLVFEAHELVLAVNSKSRYHDVPITVFWRQRVLRAIGAIDSQVVLPLARSVPSPCVAIGDNRFGQFKGDYSVVVWNTQALLAVDPFKHET